MFPPPQARSLSWKSRSGREAAGYFQGMLSCTMRELSCPKWSWQRCGELADRQSSETSRARWPLLRGRHHKSTGIPRWGCLPSTIAKIKRMSIAKKTVLFIVKSKIIRILKILFIIACTLQTFKFEISYHTSILNIQSSILVMKKAFSSE